MAKKFLKEHEVMDLVYGSSVVHTDYDEPRRWTRGAESIVKLNVDGEEKLYRLEWDSGLTENQEDEFWAQEAPEVKLIERASLSIEKQYVDVDEDVPEDFSDFSSEVEALKVLGVTPESVGVSAEDIQGALSVLERLSVMDSSSSLELARSVSVKYLSSLLSPSIQDC